MGELRSSRKAFPGERLWRASQLAAEATVRFLRARNREGYDVYFRPYAGGYSAGYILVDVDGGPPAVLERMRAQGHTPCAVVETSPGHLQAWIRVSTQPLPARVATVIAQHLAHLYRADRASAEGRHLGRLAGFTNQELQRRLPTGLPPWVRVWQAVGRSPPRELRWWKAPRAKQPANRGPASGWPERTGGPPRAVLRRPGYREVQPLFTKPGCTDCAFPNAFPIRIGASPTSGLRKSCCARALLGKR